MKKLLLFAAIAVFGLTSVNAQEFGVKAGVDIATYTASASGFSASTSGTGFYAGGFAAIEVSDSFSFQPELLFISAKIENLDVSQIHVPLLAKFSFSDQFNAVAGPSLGYFLSAEEGMNSLNFGLEFGAAYNISEQFFLEARYNLGLANLDKEAQDYTVTVGGLFFGLGYKL